jgi:glycosyltransferase involved in cell wall biosynthesis
MTGNDTAGIRFIVYVAAGDDPDLTRESLEAGEHLAFRRIAGDPGVWWEQVALARAANEDRVDRFFAPGYTAPLRVRAPLVLTIHDISYVAHPEWFGPREGLRRRLLTRWSARRADVVLTDTEFSRSEILTLLDVPASRVRVIPLGVKSPATQALAAAVSLPVKVGPASVPVTLREPLVLFVGSILERRHVPDLIRAFARVARRHPDARLEIVGANRTNPRQDLHDVASAAGIADRVAIRDYVSDQELAELYSRARVFAFLSEYEGFGFTPLEALAARVPAVVLDTPVAREVCGDAAVYVSSPHDYDAVAAGIESLLDDSSKRREVLARGADVLSRYSWDRTARETLAALVDAGMPRTD